MHTKSFTLNLACYFVVGRMVELVVDGILSTELTPSNLSIESQNLVSGFWQSIVDFFIELFCKSVKNAVFLCSNIERNAVFFFSFYISQVKLDLENLLKLSAGPSSPGV